MGHRSFFLSTTDGVSFYCYVNINLNLVLFILDIQKFGHTYLPLFRSACVRPFLSNCGQTLFFSFAHPISGHIYSFIYPNKLFNL